MYLAYFSSYILQIKR